MISSMDSVAAVLGSRSAAWYTRSRRSSSAARTVSSQTFRYRRLSAASWGGRAPTRGGRDPRRVPEARYFGAGVLRQVVDRAAVADVAVDHPGRPRLDGVDDLRGV